jgi:hypothetical protein
VASSFSTVSSGSSSSGTRRRSSSIDSSIGLDTIISVQPLIACTPRSSEYSNGSKDNNGDDGDGDDNDSISNGCSVAKAVEDVYLYLVALSDTTTTSTITLDNSPLQYAAAVPYDSTQIIDGTYAGQCASVQQDTNSNNNDDDKDDKSDSDDFDEADDDSVSSEDDDTTDDNRRRKRSRFIGESRPKGISDHTGIGITADISGINADKNKPYITDHGNRNSKQSYQGFVYAQRFEVKGSSIDDDTDDTSTTDFSVDDSKDATASTCILGLSGWGSLAGARFSATSSSSAITPSISASTRTSFSSSDHTGRNSRMRVVEINDRITNDGTKVHAIRGEANARIINDDINNREIGRKRHDGDSGNHENILRLRGARLDLHRVNNEEDSVKSKVDVNEKFDEMLMNGQDSSISALSNNESWTSHAVSMESEQSGAHKSVNTLGEHGTTKKNNADDVVEDAKVAVEVSMLKYLLSTGTLSICVDASSWNTYISGKVIDKI